MPSLEIALLKLETQEQFIERIGAPYETLYINDLNEWYKSYQGINYAIVIVDDKEYRKMHNKNYSCRPHFCIIL